MPLYVYECDAGHRVEEVRPVAERDEVRECCRMCCDAVRGLNGYIAPAMTFFPCDLPLRRVIVPCAKVFPGADAWRKAGGARRTK